MHTHKEPRSRKPSAISAMREASRLPQPSIVDVDPEDPSQLIDEVGEFEELDVEAEPSAEADAELDAAIAESAEENAVELDTPTQTTTEAREAAAEDTGELYGVHTPPAEDRDLDKTPDAESFRDAEAGENWLETLEKKATEYGAETEEPVDVVDDSDEHPDHRGHHKTDTRDRPVADKGSGGEGGL